MAVGEAAAADHLRRAAWDLQSGYFDDAIDEALRGETSLGVTATSAMIVVSASQSLLAKQHDSARFSNQELRELIESRIPSLLESSDRNDQAIAAAAAPFCRRSVRRLTYRRLRSFPKTRRLRTSLLLWTAGRLLQVARWRLFLLGTAAVAIPAVLEVPDLAVGLVRSLAFGAWLIALVVPWPLDILGGIIAPSLTPKQEVTEPSAEQLAAIEHSANLPTPTGTLRSPVDATPGSTLVDVPIDRATMWRRVVLTVGLMFLLLGPLVGIAVVFAVIAAMRELTDGQLLLPVLSIGVLVLIYLLWTRRGPLTSWVRRAIVPAQVPMQRHGLIWTMVSSGFANRRSRYSIRAWAEGRGPGGRISRWHRSSTPPVRALYLRSFTDDRPTQKGDVSALTCIQFASINWIDIIVVPNPGSDRELRGVITRPVPDGQDWLDHITMLAHEVDLIAIALGPTEGLATELGMLRSAGLLHKAALVVPFGRQLDWLEIEAYLGELGVDLALTEWPGGRPLAVVPGSVPTAFTTRSRVLSFARTVFAHEFAFRLVLERAQHPPAPC